jgi:DNA-binding NarL/FixJ family response regulator
MGPKMRILLADDHQMVREGLKGLLELVLGAEVVGEAGDGRTALDMARKLEPDIIVMDVGMPGLNGIEATRQILGDRPDTRVIALSMHSEKRFVLGMLDAGASGYVLKESAIDELTKAIETVAAGQTYLSPKIAATVVDALRMKGEPSDATQPAASLTPREREVLQLIAEGQTTKEIAEGLHVSVKTVEAHRRGIMEKLDLHNVAQLTRYAIREGLSS